MKYYEIDLTGLKNQDDLHDRLAVELGLPETYGRDLESFPNVLSSLEIPCTITI